jgi:hypothetical protein
MLNHAPFYFSINRKMSAAFGTIFNELAIPRYDDAGNVTQLLRVPISYGPKEKVLARLIGDPGIDRPDAISLPRMSFEMTSFQYDGDRRLNSVQSNSRVDPNTKDYKHQYLPVPYDWHFTLWVYAKDIEDCNKIMEQILVFFQPEFPIKIDLIPEMGVSINVPVILNSTTSEDSYSGDFKERRAIIWTLDFTMKGYLYGPIMVDKIIKFANVNFYAPTVADLQTAVGNSVVIDRVTSQPGLTANGQPTTHIAETIPYRDIVATDDFGYIDIISGDLTQPTITVGGDQSNNLPVANTG